LDLISLTSLSLAFEESIGCQEVTNAAAGKRGFWG